MTSLSALFRSFFKIGLFTFGGGYAMIPLIEAEIINRRGWLARGEIMELLALAQSSPRPIAINSWDRTLIPKPFATIVLHHGEPLFVPTPVSHAEVEVFRQELETRLNTLYDEVWAEFGLPAHDLGVAPRKRQKG